MKIVKERSIEKKTDEIKTFAFNKNIDVFCFIKHWLLMATFTNGCEQKF